MQCYNHDKISWDTFWCFVAFKQEKCSLSSPTPSMQCCATVAACRKQQNFRVWQTWQGYITCVIVVILTWHYCVLVLHENICSKEGEVWQKIFSNKIFVMLVAQGLPSFFAPPSCCIFKSSLLSDTIQNVHPNMQLRFWITKNQEPQSSPHATHLLTERDCSEITNMFQSSSFNVQGKTRSLMLDNMDHYTFLGDWPPTPPPSQHFALSEKYNVSVNVGLGEG